MMRVLVTRPEPDASAFAEELRALGHDPVLQPLLEFRSIEFDPAPLYSAQGLIVTSGNALRAVVEHLPGVAGVPLSTVSLYCVGAQTARRARSAGLGAVEITANSARELAAKIICSVRRETPLVHLSGEHQAFDLSNALRREGFTVETLLVYAMAARSSLDSRLVTMFEAGDIDGVVLMSARTAQIFVSLSRSEGLLNCVKRPCYFCLSENVAKELAPLAPDFVKIATTPNRKAILELIAESGPIHCSKHRLTTQSH